MTGRRRHLVVDCLVAVVFMLVVTGGTYYVAHERILDRAHAIMGDQQRLLEAGCDGYVAKPFKIETLAAEITRVLG